MVGRFPNFLVIVPVRTFQIATSGKQSGFWTCRNALAGVKWSMGNWDRGPGIWSRPMWAALGNGIRLRGRRRIITTERGDYRESFDETRGI